VFFVRMKSVSARKTRLLIKNGLGFVFQRDRRLRADALFIRAQSAIRADAPPSAQAQSLRFDASGNFR